MIITIDGPAGAGKSSVSHEVARRLGFDFLDTGAMYRALGLSAIRRGISLDDAEGLAAVARESQVGFDWTLTPPEVTLDGQPVGHLVRSAEASSSASRIAVVPAVREVMVKLQQQIGRERGNIVTEGRDQGSVVFPDAGLKVYLDASPQERARRRVEQLRAKGESADYQQILDQIIIRDKRDSSRSVGPLSIPQGAKVIDTTNLTQDQVIELLVEQARAVMSGKGCL